MSFDNTNKGALYPNKNKQGNQPDCSGKINVNGKDYRIAGWTKHASEESKLKTGTKFISLSVSEIEEDEMKVYNPEETRQRESVTTASVYSGNTDENIPF